MKSLKQTAAIALAGGLLYAASAGAQNLGVGAGTGSSNLTTGAGLNNTTQTTLNGNAQIHGVSANVNAQNATTTQAQAQQSNTVKPRHPRRAVSKKKAVTNSTRLTARQRADTSAEVKAGRSGAKGQAQSDTTAEERSETDTSPVRP